MKNQTVLCKKGALLAIALFLIVGIAAIVPFLIQSSESAGERAKYSDEWNKIQWAVSGIKNKHIEKGVKSDFYNPYGNSTVATISYGDFHVSVNVSERKTMLDRNSCFSVIPSVYRGSSQPYADGGYDLSDYAVNSNSAPGVAAGAKHSFAWKKDGTLYAWGYNNIGQLGLDDKANRSSPQKVKQGDLATPGSIDYFNQGWLVAGGNETALAVDYSGNAYGWGKLSENNYISFIDLLTGDGIAKIPMSFDASNVLDIACGNGFFALLTSDRKIKYSSWNSKFGKESSLSLLNGLSEINGISGNGDHLLAITSNGDIWGYGSNEKYQLGRNDSSLKGPIKINSSEIMHLSWVSLGNSNSKGPEITQFYISSAVNLATFTVVASNQPRNQEPALWITTYQDFIFLDSDNNANDRELFVTVSEKLDKNKYCWKYEINRRIEPGTYTVRLKTKETYTALGWFQETTETEVDINGRWYKNTEGSDGGKNENPDKLKGVYSFYGSLATATNFIGVAAGSDFSLALKKEDDKTVLYSWGTNAYGQLGLGHNNTAENMTEVSDFTLSGDKIRSLSAGGAHALALTESGKVYAWGRNNYGQLGIANNDDKNVPTLLTTLSGKKIISIAAGENHSLAMDDAFNVYSWGLNSSGQLGLGHTTNINTPIQVPDL